MPATPPTTSAERNRGRAIVLWTVFAVLLALGLVLYFRYGSRIVPVLDAAGER